MNSVPISEYGVILAVDLSIDHAYGMPTYKISLDTRLHGKRLIEDDLSKRSAKHANKSTLVAGGADTQVGSSCLLAPLATNVDLWKPIVLSNFEKGELKRLKTQQTN